jgi:phosphonopyruvate decarboxylase
MIQSETFIRGAKERGFLLYTGVPCSYLKPFINCVIGTSELTYIGAANEGEAVAIASGAELAGARAVVMFQNSGFGNAVNPLTSLNMIFRIPVLVIVTWRGEPGGDHDEPQHQLMGEITPRLFDLMRIPWEMFPRSEEEIGPVLDRAVRHMVDTGTPYGLLMSKDSAAPHPLARPINPRLQLAPVPDRKNWPSHRPSRREALKVVQEATRPSDAIIGTTGYIGRTLFALDDRPNQLYLVGSMGCASSLALGLATVQPRRRIIVIDGDGAALMHLGALATIGYERPSNLIHLVLDNEMHESTGGQSTVSHSISFSAIAAACGYSRVLCPTSFLELEEVLRSREMHLTLVHVKIRPGDGDDLPRPKSSPVQIATRFREWMRETTRNGEW